MTVLEGVLLLVVGALSGAIPAWAFGWSMGAAQGLAHARSHYRHTQPRPPSPTGGQVPAQSADDEPGCMRHGPFPALLAQCTCRRGTVTVHPGGR